MATALTLRELNVKNREFWSVITESFITADEDILLQAFDMHRSEVSRGIGFREQHPIEYFVHQILKSGSAARASNARKGGRVEKRDALTRFIDDVVHLNRAITVDQLMVKLESEASPDGWLWQVTPTEITFAGPRGVGKIAPVSGLKDRLLRARKKPSSR